MDYVVSYQLEIVAWSECHKHLTQMKNRKNFLLTYYQCKISVGARECLEMTENKAIALSRRTVGSCECQVCN